MSMTIRADHYELGATFGNTLVDAQLALETRMVSLGRDQVRKAIEGAKQAGNESGTGYGKTLISMSVDTISEAIGAFVAKANAKGAGRRHIAVKYLKQVDWDVASYIAMRTIVDSLTGRRQLLQRVAIHIGSRIEDEVRFSEFKQENNKGYSRGLERAKRGTSYHRKKATMSGFERRYTEEDWTSWPEVDRLHLGSALIDMIVATDLVVVAEEITSRKHTNKVLHPTEELAKWVEREVAKTELLTPMHMPMIVPPLSYTNPFNGGYLTKEVQGRATMVKAKNRAYMQELADKADTMPMVYDSINALQNTRWQINPTVKRVFAELWEQGQSVAKLPDRTDIEAVACPQCGSSLHLPKLNTRGKVNHGCFEDALVLRQWKKDAHKAHTKNVSLRSRRLSTAKTLKVAETYTDFDVIYFPVVFH